MNPFFKQQIETAQKVNGISFDVLADWAELQDLHALAEIVIDAEARGDAATMRPCVEVGGLLFHRITIGAANWFHRVAELLGADHGETYSLAFAYAFHGARDPVALLWPYADTRKALESRLKEWQRGLGCTPEELFTALAAFADEEREVEMPGDEKREDEPAKKHGHGWLVDTLCSEYGGTPEQWIWHTPRAQISQMIREINARRRAEKGASASDPNDPRVIASHRFDIRLKAIVEKKKAAA